MSFKTTHKCFTRRPVAKRAAVCGDKRQPRLEGGGKWIELEMQIKELRDANYELQNIKRRLEKQVREKTVELRRSHEKFDRSQKELKIFAQDAVERLERERLKVSVQLHDTIAQNLATLKLFLENRLARMDEERVPSSYSIEPILEIIQDTLKESRWLINYLRPKMLDELGLLASIQWHCRDFRNRHSDLAVKMNLTATEADIPTRLKLIVYRIIQEATNNIESHNQTIRIDFDLTSEEHTLKLRVRNHGNAFYDEPIRSESELDPGLTRIKEYAELSGGRFAFRPLKNKGTCVEAQWDIGNGQCPQLV